MTQEQHPIAPPSEDHVLKWSDEWFEAKVKHMTREKHLCMQAARWGADQELEACCEVLARELICDGKHVATDLRDVRRLKPPSLKEQALCHLESFAGSIETLGMDSDLILRAIQSLPD